ncbi:MAG: hypothetical protein RMK65_03660 [Anaerolineae bacterium]|nr:hypothetical protein [Anaerolineae bacterium]MCX8068696.1 hypothetical protein [Anaerolineae bacterium]MDW7991235.1 hypothetical protein [Anaerolineae bacterium]
MPGFFGTQALLIADLALIAMWALGLVAVGGWVVARRRGFPTHCRLMAWVTFAAYLPILVAMVGPWLGLFRLGSAVFAQPQTVVPFMHGVVGGLAQLLMTYTVVRMNWRRKWPPRRPLWLMRVSLLFWLLTVVGGTWVYLTLYA